MLWRCSEPRVLGSVNVDKLLSIVKDIHYDPPRFERLVLYTPQFCKVPLPGQKLSKPRPDFEEKGLLYGELFKADGWILIDIDVLNDVHPIVAWKVLVKKLGEGYIIYPTRRGVHIFAKGRAGFFSNTVNFDGIAARLEVKPCWSTMCTSWYRTLNAFSLDGKVLVINGRYAIIVESWSGKPKVYEFDNLPVDYTVVSEVLGIGDVAESTRGPGAPGPGISTLPGDLVEHFNQVTDNRRILTIFKNSLASGIIVEPEDLIESLEDAYKSGSLPPCLEPIVTGVHQNNRFATMVLLVAALSATGFAIDKERLREYCETFTSRWGGSLNQCVSKLKSIVVCHGERCVYAYGSSLLRSALSLVSCEKTRCSIVGCPGASKPIKTAILIGRQIAGYIQRRVFKHALGRLGSAIGSKTV